MRYARVFLALALAVAWLGSQAGSAAPGATGHSIGPTVEAGSVPTGVTPSGGQSIEAQLAKLTAADGADGDWFGSAVSVSGDTAAVGAEGADVGGNEDQGAAYIFYRNQEGLDAWGQVTKLMASDGAQGEFFGASVSVSGGTLVVGARAANVGANGDQGAAYVFYRNQGGPDAWGQVAKLTASDGVAFDYFGWSVSVSGDTAVVGARRANVGGNEDQGAAYIFYRNQGGSDAWGQVAKLTGSDGAQEEFFGCSVSVSGGTLVVGAEGADVGGNEDQGAAYTFYRNQGGPDAWGQVAKLTAIDGAEGGAFGRSVSVSSDTVVIGANGAGISGNDDQGAAYVFYRNQSGPNAWRQLAKLTASDGAPWDTFGCSVSVHDDTAVVGAVLGGNLDQGAAYIFYRSHGGADAWGQVAKLTAADGLVGDNLGGSVSVDGETALAGAEAVGSNPWYPRGAAYVYALWPVAWEDAYTTTIMSTLLQVPAALGILANDLNPNGGPLTAVLDTAPAHGTLDLHSDGAFTYSPAANWHGVDTFTYRANNGRYNSDVAMVKITVFGCFVYLPLVLHAR